LSPRGSKPVGRYHKERSKARAAAAAEAKLPELPMRVSEGKDGAFNKLCALYGQHRNPPGPLRADAEWECLRRLGEKHFGAGRWLPSYEASSGTEAGLSWTTKVQANYSGSKIDLGDFRQASMRMRYPGTSKTGEVLIRKLVSLPQRATYGLLCFYGVAPGDMYDFERVPLLGIADGGVDACFRSRGTMFSVAEPGENNKLGFRLSEGGEFRQTGWNLDVVALPVSMVEQLYPRAAGRERSAALLRDLMRHAEIAVASDKRIPFELKGKATMALASLALTHNKEQELALISKFKLGCLELNEALTAAFTEPTGLYGIASRCMRSVRAFIRFAKRPWVGEDYMVSSFYGAAAAFFIAYWRKMLLSLSGLTTAALRAVAKAQFTTVARVRKLVARLVAMAPVATLPKGIPLKPGRVSLQGFGASSMLWNVVLEEVIKRAVPMGTPAIIVMEAMRHRSWYYAPTAVMHAISAKLDPLMGVAVHWGWNAVLCEAPAQPETIGAFRRLRG